MKCFKESGVGSQYRLDVFHGDIGELFSQNFGTVLNKRMSVCRFDAHFDEAMRDFVVKRLGVMIAKGCRSKG